MVAEKFEVETTYIRAWAETGAFGLEISARIGARLRELGLDLTDLNHLLKTGSVVGSDMDEDRGLWSLLGECVEGERVAMEVIVDSKAYRIEVVALELV